MGTKHEWARDWFGTRRPPKPEDLAEGPTGPPPTYCVQLFYEREPRLDKDVLLSQLRKNCGTVELKDESDSMFFFDFHDFKAPTQFFFRPDPQPGEQVIDGDDIPYKCSISAPSPALAMEDMETSLSQTGDWPEGGSVLSACRAMVVVHDLLANWHDHRVRLAVFQKIVRTLLEIAPCEAIHWVPSLRVVNPEAFLLSQQSGPSHCPTHGAFNVRLFQVEGGAPGEFCLDTMGLATLGLPDVQFAGSGCDPGDVADAVYDTANLIFETGAGPPEGPPVESPRCPGLLCRAATALVPPLRAAVTVRPSEQLAAEWLARRQVQDHHCISYWREEHGVAYHGTISDIDGVPRATWSCGEAGQKTTRDLPMTAEAFAFLCRGFSEFGIFRRCLVRPNPGERFPGTPADRVNNHCIAFEEGPELSLFLVPALEADPDFARWLVALNVPKPAAARETLQQGTIHSLGDEHDLAIADYAEAVRLDPKSAIAYFNRGSAYASKGEHEQAIADFTQGLQLSPNDAKAFVCRGTAYAETGRRDKAIADLTQAIRLDPKDTKAYVVRGNAYDEQGQSDRAIADYSEAIRLDPRYAFAHYNRGVAYRNQGQHEKAMADYSEAIRLDPKLVAAYINRGSTYYRNGEYDKAIADSTAAIQVDPNEADAYGNRALAYAGKGEYDRAIADFTEAVRLDPSLAQAYWDRGMAYGSKGELDKAIADFSEAIRLDPGNPAAYVARGNAYDGRGEYERAIADYADAIRLDPDDPAAYGCRGTAHDRLGEHDKAIADYTKAIRLDPNLCQAYHDRGTSYFNTGEYERAIADYTDVIRLDPESPLGYYARGCAHAQKSDYDAAVRDYTTAIGLDPKLVDAYRNRGLAYNEKEDCGRALADFSEAIRLDPNDAFAYCERGAIYNSQEEYDKAATDFTEAIRLDPTNAFAYCNRGYAYDSKNRYDQAIADYAEAIRLDPEHDYAHNALAWLLATCPDAKYRDGSSAVERATRACELSQWEDCYCLGTLAAACAEAGEFNHAIKWQTKANELATSDYDTAAAASRLELYRSGKSYQEEQ